MHRLVRLLVIALVLLGLALPLAADALGTSFGGRVVLWSPCLTPTGPGFWITIRPAGIFPITYIWGPGSLGLPPLHVAQQILGIADVPYSCTVPVPFPPYAVPLYGQRIQIDGVGL